MTSYILKSILCSGLLLLFYHLFLEKEKMHHVNRFYLLASMLFALIIPLITLDTKLETAGMAEQLPMYSLIKGANKRIITNALPVSSGTANPRITFIPKLLFLAYALISFLLLLRFVRNLTFIRLKKSNNTVINYRGAQLVLLPQDTVTYTFLNHIFVAESAFHAHLIEDEILTHELAHVHQKHSWDILFLEILQSLFWINPLFIFYKKAVQLNHEFLADDAVLVKYQDAKRYQLLLLDKILHTGQINLTSGFNYSITKKRLAMMTTNTNVFVAGTKQAGIVILFTCMTLLFSSKEISAQKEKTQPHKITVAAKAEGVTIKQFEEYEATLKKMITTRIGRDGKKYNTYYSMMDNDLVKKADVIYRFMSEDQRSKATKVAFIPMLPVPEVTRPSQVQLDEWLDSKKFGVWLDDRRISNTELKKYKPTDFEYYFISKLEKNAVNYGKHYFQIGLSTPKNFRAWQKTHIPLTIIPD